MDNSDLDQLRLAYKQAVDEWVLAIRAEEALATPYHSEIAWEHWTMRDLWSRMFRAKPNLREMNTRMRCAK